MLFHTLQNHSKQLGRGLLTSHNNGIVCFKDTALNENEEKRWYDKERPHFVTLNRKSRHPKGRKWLVFLAGEQHSRTGHHTSPRPNPITDYLFLISRPFLFPSTQLVLTFFIFVDGSSCGLAKGALMSRAQNARHWALCVHFSLAYGE